jgi:hypothetical protein
VVVDNVLASSYTAECEAAGMFKHRYATAYRWAYAVAPSLVRAAWNTKLDIVTDRFSAAFKAWVRRSGLLCGSCPCRLLRQGLTLEICGVE